MNNCKFYVKSFDKTIELTYDELVGYLLANGFTAANSKIKIDKGIKYSLAKDTTDKLKAESKEHKLTVSQVVGNEEKFEESKYITALGVVDSDAFRSLGFMTIPKKDDSEYFDNMVKILMSQDMSEEDAKQKTAWTIRHWDTIADDALALHKFLPYGLKYINNITEFTKVLQKPEFKKLYERLKGTTVLPDGSIKSKIALFQETLWNIENTTMNNIRSAMDVKNSSTALNVFVDVELPKLGKTLGLHFDKIFVDLNNELYLINYKFSASPVTEWSSTKKEKYKYMMALTKRALEAKGYNVNGVKIYDIPIYLEYDGDDIKQIRRDPNQEYINYVIENNKAALLKYENFVKLFIDVSVNVQKQLDDNDKQIVDDIIGIIFPRVGMHSEGIQLTAEQWIKNNIGTSIIPNSDLSSNVKYFVDLQDGKPVIEITEETTPTKNKQIIELVNKHTELLNNGELTIMNHLVKAIRSNYRNKTSIFSNGSGFRFSSNYLQSALLPYFEYIEENDEKIPIWEMIETPELHKAGLLLFRHKDTGQIDLIIASPYNVSKLIRMKNGQTSLLGMHMTDINAGRMLKATYGNMEIMRGLLVLNQLLPGIKGDFNLGNIKVITPSAEGSGTFRTFSNTLPYFGRILQFANTRLENKVINNLHKVKTTNPIDSILNQASILMSLQSINDVDKQRIQDFGFNNLSSDSTISGKIQSLRELMNCIEAELNYPDIKTILSLSIGRSDKARILANIYLEANQTILAYSGMSEFAMDKISKLERYILPQYANPDPNVRMIANIYTKALDETAVVFQEQYTPAKKAVQEFYNEKGYSDVEKVLSGRSVALFDNLFLKDEKGEKQLIFKNPYTDSTLSQEEKKFLKRALFHLAKIKKRMGLYLDFTFANENDSGILSWLERGNNKITYFYVPLKLKSLKTRTSSPIDTFVEMTRKAKRKINEYRADPAQFIKNLLEEAQEKFEYAEEDSDTPIEKFKVVNRYHTLENAKERARYINRFGKESFETDVELLLADFTASQVIAEQMTKVQIKAKAILTQLHLLGSVEGHEKELQDSIKEIEDFLKLNVFGQSIMERNSLKLMLVLKPLKSLVSSVYIAGNIKSAVRDTSEGVWQNLMRTINNYLTDLTAKSVLEAYRTVISDSTQSMRGIGKMSELCLRYRLSNTDEAKIADRATLRGGLFDPTAWMYSTLRGPDFLNRMVLFTARCIQDGVWEAYSVDEDGNLKYDWRKDARFSELAINNTQSPKYAELKGLYMSLIQLYNLEHENANLSYNDDLPEPYSLNQISSFKRVADSIYGAYDKSQRPKLENILIGQTYCMFSTWLNGMTANYFKRPGEYAENFEVKLATDNNGNLLFFDKDGRIFAKEGDSFVDELGLKVELNEYFPIYKLVPIQVQGIIYTLRDAFNILSEGGWNKETFDAVKKNIWDNPYEQANLKKLFSDILMSFFMFLIFGVALKGGYEEYKKNKKADEVIENSMVELLYTSVANSYDGFKGPLALVSYALNDTEPLAVNATISLTKDVGKSLFGSLSWETLLYKDVPVFRAFKLTHTKLSKIGQKKLADSNKKSA